MAPGLPKKPNRFPFQAQHEHASALLKRNTLLDGPRPVVDSSQEQGKRQKILRAFSMKASNSSRAQRLINTYKEVVNDLDGQKNVTETQAPITPSMETSRMDHMASQKTTSPVLGDTQSSERNEEGSPIGTRSSVAETNTEEHMDQNDDSLVTKKPVRGVTRGVGLYKYNQRESKKLEIVIDPKFGRALKQFHSVKFANELGQIASGYLWPIRKNRNERKKIFGDVLLKLQGKLTITNIRHAAVQEKIWRHFIRVVRGKREYYHKLHFNGKGKGEGNGATAKKFKPGGVPEAMWNSLCDYWDDEKVKKICQKNKANRAKLTKPHTEGPVSFVSSLHELKEQHGDSFTLIDFWKKSHTKKNGDWASVECEIEYDKMNEKVNASMETENPIAPDEAFFETLGTGHGYIKGLGYGPTPPSARKTYLETDNEELRELNNKLVEENQQLKEKCVELQDNVNDLKARQEATEAKQAEIQAENDARQAENDARQAASDAKQAEMEKMLLALMARNA